MIRKKLFIFSADKIWINVRKGISIVCVLIMLIVGMDFFNQLLINKNCLKKYTPFFSGEQEYDVLFFGSSHVQMGVSILDLFHDYGITGYNLAVEGNFIQSNYYKMKVVLEYLVKEKRQLPKVIVMDIFDDEQKVSHLHSAWDSYPLSLDKWKMTNRLVPEEERYPMLMPFLLYHKRWNELTQDDFQPYINKTFGTSNGGYGVGKADREDVVKITDIVEIDEDTATCVRQMKEMCKKLDIQLIFIHIPYSYKPEIQRKANGIYQYAEANGILCVDYMNEDIGIDFDIDFFDEGHLNRAGMRIVTDEIGRLLSGGGVESRRS